VTRQAIGAALVVLTEQDFQFENDGATLADYEPAYHWFAKTHPTAAAAMNKSAALDGVDWDERLAKIDWTQGSPARGEKVYAKRACASCHAGRNRLGPGLEGVTGRWAREDLIKEIVDPNRNVAPQFMTSRFETVGGKVYQGIPVYESPDGTLLQTGPNETIRIAGTEVVNTSRSRTSLMPTGLLQGLGDGEIADLYAYLKTLTTQTAP
jgi:putative heme-binding domain-containing protein